MVIIALGICPSHSSMAEKQAGWDKKPSLCIYSEHNEIIYSLETPLCYETTVRDSL